MKTLAISVLTIFMFVTSASAAGTTDQQELLRKAGMVLEEIKNAPSSPP